MPEEISALIGGLPTSFDDLPEGFDPALLKTILDAKPLDAEQAAPQ